MFQNSWTPILQAEFKQPYFQTLAKFIHEEYETHTIYPRKDHVFRAFELTPLEQIKVVILGQDPYHQPHQAMGLSFSVPHGCPLPPSLRNIYTELADDLGIHNENGDLTSWAKQGVFLLNTVLTVRANQAFSHHDQGWETFTDHMISLISAQPQPIVFILWGRPAQQKMSLIDTHHTIITSSHPSPLSAYRGFFGSRPFSRTNQKLEAYNRGSIDWRID